MRTRHSLNTQNPDIQQMAGSGLEFTENGTISAFSGCMDTRFQKQQALGATQHSPALPPSGSHWEIPELGAACTVIYRSLPA